MTKTQRADLWFKNSLNRLRMKETEAHVQRISQWIIIACTLVLYTLYQIKGG